MFYLLLGIHWSLTTSFICNLVQVALIIGLISPSPSSPEHSILNKNSIMENCFFHFREHSCVDHGH